MNPPQYPTRRRMLYRSRDGVIFGVCKGLAYYADLPVFWIRAILVIVTVLTSFLPLALLYLAAAIIMKPEPVMAPQTEEDWEFYNSFASSRTMALARLKRKFDKLERRARRIENIITAREFDWEHRLNTGA